MDQGQQRRDEIDLEATESMTPSFLLVHYSHMAFGKWSRPLFRARSTC
jgi:hypothetical protein